MQILSQKSDLVRGLSEKTVFEREDNPLMKEPVLLMQLAAQQLVRLDRSKLSTREFVSAFSSVVDLVCSVDANPFDMHLWGDLFDSFFGGLCALHLMAQTEESKMLLDKLNQLRLPHLLDLTLKKKNMTWLIEM